MPNTAIETGDSMTCISVDDRSRTALPVAEAPFGPTARGFRITPLRSERAV